MGSRREFLKGSVGLAALSGCGTLGVQEPADTLIVNARVNTLDPRKPRAEAIAVKGERILAVGSEAELNVHKNMNTRVIDAGGRTVVPGINDAHTHFIRGGLTYTNEVRWDGVPSLAEGMRRVREQARRTPPPHWVQVIGGWTWAQFQEKRFPTLDEINAATGDTPCMIMHLYDRAWLNRSAVRVLGWEKEVPKLFGGYVERDASGNVDHQPRQPGVGVAARAAPVAGGAGDLDALFHARAQPPRRDQRHRRGRRRAEFSRQLRRHREARVGQPAHAAHRL
jgi:predicted amidohydrolase YtcJ